MSAYAMEFKSRRPDELKGVKPVLDDGVRDVGDKPGFSVRYGKSNDFVAQKYLLASKTDEQC